MAPSCTFTLGFWAHTHRPIIIVDSIKDAVEFAAARPRPLASYIFSNSAEHQKLFSERVISGALGINEVTLQAALPTLPFGGVGPSGMGRYHSKHSFDLFTNEKAVLHSGFKFDPPVKVRIRSDCVFADD